MRRNFWIAALLGSVAALPLWGVEGPGRVDLPLTTVDGDVVGQVVLFNDNQALFVEVQSDDPWRIAQVDLHAGWAGDPIPLDLDGRPLPNHFTYRTGFRSGRLFEDGFESGTTEAWDYPVDPPEPPFLRLPIYLDFLVDLDGFAWGEPWENQRVRHVAVHVEVVDEATLGNDVPIDWPALELVEAWAEGPLGFDPWPGNWLEYEMAHKARGHFVDSPVQGLQVDTPTLSALTDDSGGFDYFPGEAASFALGSQPLGSSTAGQRLCPMDLFPASDLDDPRVANMAMLLQSLDADADPQPGIQLTPEVVSCFDEVIDLLGPIDDWSDDAHVDDVVNGTIARCSRLTPLVRVEREDALANLDRAVGSSQFRKNVSSTPSEGSAKAKLNVMPVWFPALRANGDPATYLDDGVLQPGIPYYDEDGNLIRVADDAKPLIVVYTDALPGMTSQDVFGAVSRDDGGTWKRMNLSRTADISSYRLTTTGREYPGDARKPVFQVKDNKVLVAWTSKYCRGGRPTFAIDLEDDDPNDDPYWQDDIWGVGGQQLAWDYTEDGFPEVGEIPYSCLWTARGVVVTPQLISSSPAQYGSYEVGDVVWFKPERLTSGRRDAYQVFVGAAAGAGFGIVWQEDPDGLRPGSSSGPGDGWSGATVSHKTEIWYTFIPWGDHSKIDAAFVPGGDPEHDLGIGRPKALVPMPLPVRLTENASVNTDNLMVELDDEGYPVEDAEGNWIPIFDEEGKHAGTHRYGYEIDGLCESFYEFVNNQGAEKKVCVTADNILLDGDTGASRPNLFLQTYTKPDGTKSAWALVAYEETKGVGGGAPDHTLGEGPYETQPCDPMEDPSRSDEYKPDEGKNVIYHTFDASHPDLARPGSIVNHPERDELGQVELLRNEDGTLLLDWLGRPQFAYENARRPRFVLQSKSAVGDSMTVALILYKEGEEGKGRPSDIMARRVVADAPGNPYQFSNFVCEEWSDLAEAPTVCTRGARNLSSTTPTEIWENPDADPDSEGENRKVWKWVQSPDNLLDASSTNPFEDARAHRGQIRGDWVIIGYTHTPNWGADRNGNDKHDFYVRRSFDGGLTWTTDPLADEAVERCQTFTNPETQEKEEVCSDFAPGANEPAHNVSQLPNAKSTVIEPRIVAAPGTIKIGGAWTGLAEDKQNQNVAYLSYGTSTNPKKDPETGLQDAKVPEDLFFSFTQDRGQTYALEEWEVNPDSDGNNAGETVQRWFRLAIGDPEQSEAQLRLTPDGSRFYASWLEEFDLENTSDVHFRRVCPRQFGANN